MSALAPVLEATLANLAVALALAFGAWAAGRGGRAPALAHGLWLLALLKLVTPPLFRLPIELPRSEVQVAERAESSSQAELLMWTELAPGPLDATPIAELALADEVAPSSTPIEPARPLPWRASLVIAWALGALIAWAFAARRVRIVLRIVRLSSRAPRALEREACAIARRLGLARVPEIRLVSARLAPMLWAPARRASLVLPEELVARLDGDARRALLAHELAHYRRRDHLVRWLELLVRGLHWWNPLARVCVRGLRSAEEACCDAWVVWALPGSERAYAGALLETADFLNGWTEPTPLSAGALSPARELERRLTMILRADAAKSLTRRGRLGLLAVGVAALPFLPAFSQVTGPLTPQDSTLEIRERLEQAEVRRAELEAKLEALVQERNSGGLRPAHAHAKKLDLEIAALHEQLAPFANNLEALHEHLGAVKRIHEALAGGAPVGVGPSGTPPGGDPSPEQLELRRRALTLGAELLAKNGHAEEALALMQLSAELGAPSGQPPMAGYGAAPRMPEAGRISRTPYGQGGGAGIGRYPKADEQAWPRVAPPSADVEERYYDLTRPRSVPSDPTPAPGAPAPDDRFERLERRVEELTRMVEVLAAGMQKGSAER